MVARRIDFFLRGVKVARGSFIARGVFIGNHTRINAKSHIGPCTIGSYCAIGGRLIVRSTDHYTNYLNMQDHLQRIVLKSVVSVAGKSKGDVKIGNGVWIGDSVIILGGVSVGDGAVIGAGSVVTRDVPPYAIAVGNPAKVIKYRFKQEIINLVRGVDWWNWSKAKMVVNKSFFELDLSVATEDVVINAITGIKQ